MKQNDWVKGILFASAGATGWGISGVCSQYLFSHYTLQADWLTAVRMILSGIVLLLIALPKEGPKQLLGIFQNKTDCKQLIAFAILGLLLCQYTFLAAIQHSNSGTATVLQSLNVVMMAVVVAVQTRTPMHKKQILAILLAVIGTFLIATNGQLSQMALSVPALIFGLLAAAGVVIYTLLSRPIIKTWGNIPITGWGMLIGGLVLGVVVQAWNIPSGLDLKAILLIAVIVLVGTAGGFSLFLQGVRYLGPVKGTLIGCLEPASATLLSFLFLNTTFSAMELVGFLAIMGTVLLSIQKE